MHDGDRGNADFQGRGLSSQGGIIKCVSRPDCFLPFLQTPRPAVRCLSVTPGVESEWRTLGIARFNQMLGHRLLCSLVAGWHRSLEQMRTWPMNERPRYQVSRPIAKRSDDACCRLTSHRCPRPPNCIEKAPCAQGRNQRRPPYIDQQMCFLRNSIVFSAAVSGSGSGNISPDT